MRILIQDDNGIVRPALSDEGRQLIVRPDHDEKIFSFAGIVELYTGWGNIPQAQIYIGGPAVPAGEIHTITTISWVYEGTPPTSIAVNIMGLASDIVHSFTTVITSALWVTTSCLYHIQEGDFIQVHLLGGTIGDDIYMKYAGTKMKTP